MISIIKCALQIIAVVTFGLLALLIFQFNRLPPDTAVVNNFQTHRNEFENLQLALLAEPGYFQIFDVGSSAGAPIEPSTEAKYRDSMRRLGILSVAKVERINGTATIQFCMGATGVVGSPGSVLLLEYRPEEVKKNPEKFSKILIDKHGWILRREILS